MTGDNSPAVGASWALLATVCFTFVDVIIKFLSGDYPLYQVTFLRTLVAMAFILGVLMPLTGSFSDLKTRRLGTHLLRGMTVVLANFLFFVGLAAMPLAEAVAIFFVSPLLIALFSVLLLGEAVGPRRWAAIAVGLVGVLIVLRPGSDAFQFASLLPVGAAACYGMLHILTRKIGAEESATTLVLYAQFVMLGVSIVAGLTLGHGHFDVVDHPSAAFILRAWAWPEPYDAFLILVLGLSIAIGGFAISAAYRKSAPAFIAPFEYVAMPIAIVWGIVVFNEWPDQVALAGTALIILSGLVLIWREAVARKRDSQAGGIELNPKGG